MRGKKGQGKSKGGVKAGVGTGAGVGARSPVSAGTSGSPSGSSASSSVQLPVRTNEYCEAQIIGIGHEGEGVGRVDGFTLFVPGALPGERVRVQVGKLKKQFGYARLVEVLERSAERVEPPCPVYDNCGGCQLQHLDYAAQLRWKRQTVVDSLERIGKLRMDAVTVHPTLGMDEPWRYRNKAQVPVGPDAGASAGEDGGAGLVTGFYALGSHRIVDTEACLIQPERSNAAVQAVRRIAGELGIAAYDEERRSGVLRHVVVRIGAATGELMIVLVTASDRLPHRDELCRRLAAAMPGVSSICQNVNAARTQVVFGEQTRVLWGSDVIHDEIGGVRFAISARSFYQVNPAQTEVLYGKALEYAALTGEESVIDAYCGIGTISLFLARRARRVYGVEIVPEAVADARRNAALNGIGNVEFAVGAAETVMPRWREQGIAADVIVVDPPRKGCDPALLDTIVRMRPQRVVYVSCNPATLARDLRVLEDGGYRLVEVQPVDMFPWTAHVEAASLLVWSDTDSWI